MSMLSPAKAAINLFICWAPPKIRRKLNRVKSGARTETIASNSRAENRFLLRRLLHFSYADARASDESFAAAASLFEGSNQTQIVWQNLEKADPHLRCS